MPRIAWNDTGRPTKLSVPFAVHVGPRLVDRDRLLEGDAGDLGGEPADRRRRNAGFGCDRFRRVFRIEIFFGEQLERRHGEATVGELTASGQRRPRTLGPDRHDALGDGFEDQRLRIPVAGEQPVIRVAGRIDHQPRRV